AHETVVLLVDALDKRSSVYARGASLPCSQGAGEVTHRGRGRAASGVFEGAGDGDTDRRCAPAVQRAVGGDVSGTGLALGAKCGPVML
ncbi:hypothetical protein HK405_010457, partial [Cladochytrium tenue]